jgi:hypothetical protein
VPALASAAAKHDDDLAHLAHGRAALAVDAAGAALREAAAAIDADPADVERAQRVALRVRALADHAGRVVLAECAQALGADPLCHDADHIRRVADLTVYLGQFRPDRHVAAYSRLLGPGPGPDL